MAIAASAASSSRPLLYFLPTINNVSNHTSLLSFSSASILSNSKSIILKSALKLKPISPRLNSPLLATSSSSFTSYGETHEDEGELEIELGGKSRTTVTSPPADAGRLYVGNLPYSITSAELVELFGQAGIVVSAEIVYDRVTDRSRGFAFVTMTSSDGAQAAIRMFNGTQVGGRTVKVNFPEVPRGGEREVMGPRTRARSHGYVDSPYKVYAGNLGWSISSESLKEAFSNQPGLLGAKVIYEHYSGKSRGYGFVSFASAEDAQSAIEMMNGKEVEGRPLRLNLASERASSGAAVL